MAVLCVLNPPQYLQDLIVFATGGLAACFLIPMLLGLYWRRMTASATIAAMLGGTGMHMGLTCWGYYANQEFRAYSFLGVNPFIWDLVGSLVLALIVVALGPKPRLDSSLSSSTTTPPRTATKAIHVHEAPKTAPPADCTSQRPHQRGTDLLQKNVSGRGIR